MAYLIKADNSKIIEIVGEGPKKTLTLEQMQKAVGGYVETIPFKVPKGLKDTELKKTKLPNGIMILDEEGKLKNYLENERATNLTRGIVADDDKIMGDVLICSNEELD